MTQNTEIRQILDKISEYKKKYYQNRLIKGMLIGIALLLSTFVFINFLEYFGRFGSTFRGILLVLFIFTLLYTFFFLILKPIYSLNNINKAIPDHKAAEDIGRYFPNIKDKLLNTIQLASNLNSNPSQLLEASIAQKTKDLKFIRFADAININENKKYLKFAIPPLLAILLLLIIWPTFFKSTERIVNFRKNYVEPAPFQFEIINKNLNAIKNEDFNLNLRLVGNTLPNDVYLVYNDRKFKMTLKDARNFNFLFSKIQEETNFHFEASGFTSNTFKITLASRPSLLSFKVNLKYPGYLNKPSESFDNLGNLIVPEGTQINWTFKTEAADSLRIIFNQSQSFNLSKGFFGDFNFQKTLRLPSNYEIGLSNKISKNIDKIAYYINVIPDQYPQITLEQLKDTKLYNYIALGGTISDDYGLTAFKFYFRQKGSNKAYKTFDIPFQKNSLSQSYFYQIYLDKLGLQKNQELEYYIQLTDNDAVNGNKSSKTIVQYFAMPTNQEFEKEVAQQINKTEDKFEDLLKKSKEFKKSIDELDKTLKSKKDLNFQDKKQIEEVLKKREELSKELNELQKQLDELKEKQNRFDKQSPELQQKMEQLQKMLNELLQNADQKTLEELKKALEEKSDNSLEKVNDFKKSERNLDKNIERTINLFKNLQLKQKVEEAAKELEKLADKQNDLADKATKPEAKASEIKKEQEQISKEFESKKEKLKDIEKLSKELKKELDTKSQDQKDISEDQEKAEEKLDNEQKSDASKDQKSAAKKMKKMAKMLKDEMEESDQKALDLDMEVLRGILENLVKVSLDQERIMKSFRTISVSDPRFVELSQQQLKISDDTKVIEDSLYVLAKRVMQIESLVTKEVTDMKNHIDESVKNIRDRKLPQAAAKQQFAMTSMNNLALMLSDTFRQMQSMSSGSGKGKKSKKGQKPSMDLGEQQKGLNQKMQGIGQSGKGGKELSKEFAQMAQEQAKIRKQLQELQEQMNGTELGKKVGNNLEELQKQMDKSENDLVNKRITPELIKRQKDIEIRLLEAEKAIKEQEMDNKRKSNTGVSINRQSPPELELFKRDKQKQVELIRTTPPNFTPFYKKQTDNYFKKLK